MPKTFMPPAEWPDTMTEAKLAEAAEMVQAANPRSRQAQVLVAEAIELLWLAAAAESADRVSVWRAHGYRPSLRGRSLEEATAIRSVAPMHLRRGAGAKP